MNYLNRVFGVFYSLNVHNDDCCLQNAEDLKNEAVLRLVKGSSFDAFASVEVFLKRILKIACVSKTMISAFPKKQTSSM